MIVCETKADTTINHESTDLLSGNFVEIVPDADRDETAGSPAIEKKNAECCGYLQLLKPAMWCMSPAVEYLIN